MIAPPDEVIEAARDVAMESPCAKSKRGVVAYHRPALERAVTTGALARKRWLVGSGFNGPPEPFTCDGSEICRRDCGKICVHAEMRALRSLSQEEDWSIISLVHVKVVGGADAVVAPGGPPSCWQCSREILDVGVHGIWLCEDKPGDKWRYYTAMEFHRATLDNKSLHLAWTR